MARSVYSRSLALLAGLLCMASSVSAAAAAPVRIMPLGDSITGSPGCWRAVLWKKLQTAGITNTKFVGTLPGQGCGFTYDGDNEGHGGFLASGIVSNRQLPGWLDRTHPDIVMMHLGTNDVWNNHAPQTITGDFTTLVGQMRAANPKTRILVAQILPMAPSNCADCGSRVVALNKQIVVWADQLNKNTTAAAAGAVPLTVVDCWTGFNAATDTQDGVHPNDAGNQKMATSWYAPLVSAIQAETGGAGGA